MRSAFVFVLLLSLVAVACSKTSAPGALPPVATGMRSRPHSLPSGKITHVIFVIQENRTFDNIFGGPSPFPDATTTAGGATLNGDVALTRVPLEGGDDPDNYHRDWLQACNPKPSDGPPFQVGAPAPCQMNGFNVAASPTPGYTPPASTKYIYSFVDYGETKPYRDIATAYTLGDHFFMGHNSESYTGHQYLFSAQSNHVTDSPSYPSGFKCTAYYEYCAFTPWGCDSPTGTGTFKLDPKTGKESSDPSGPFPCFGRATRIPPVKYPSLADRVDDKHLTWRVYLHSLCSNINALDVNASIRDGASWPTEPSMADCHEHEGARNPTKVNTKNFRVPQDTFLTDLVNTRKQLASVTWILPGPITSDHPGVPYGYCGPWWVAKIVDAVGASEYWNSTVIFVLWDDWGGFYDHVPPYVVRDQEGPGFRVPLLVVSPYAKAKHVAHTEIEFATLLKFTEQTLGLRSLDATDTSHYLHDLDDFFQPDPKPFTKIPIPNYYLCNDGSARKRNERAAGSRWLRMVGND
jgi:phospholipase C